MRRRAATGDDLTAVGPKSYEPQPILLTGADGYNWQRGNLVLGVETDIQVAGLRGSLDRLSGGNLVDDQAGLDYFGTVRGRIGYAWGHTLLYGTGGFAYGGVQDKIVVNGVARPQNSSTETAGWSGAVSSMCLHAIG